MRKDEIGEKEINRLVTEFQDRLDASALRTVLAKTDLWLTPFLRSMLRDEDDVREIRHTSMLKALKGYDRERGNFSIYIYKIARNDAFKRLQVICKHLTLSSFNPEQSLLFSDGSDQEMQREQQEDSFVLHHAIHFLPARYRDVINLHYFSGLKTREIATLLDVPEGTVKSWLDRGRMKLKGLLEKLL